MVKINRGEEDSRVVATQIWNTRPIEAHLQEVIALQKELLSALWEYSEANAARIDQEWYDSEISGGKPEDNEKLKAAQYRCGLAFSSFFTSTPNSQNWSKNAESRYTPRQNHRP